MEKRILSYLKYLEKLSKDPDKKYVTQKEDVLTQIAFFQHERLIHLIVTITFALLTMCGITATLFADNLFLLILTCLFIILLIPYIRHYYILENSVQKMYEYFDIMFDSWK